MTESDKTPPILPSEQWEQVSTLVPIACVDVLPVTRDQSGAVQKIGLISRQFPIESGENTYVWCHIGGRVLLDESLMQAAERHMRSTLDYSQDSGVLASSPYYTNEFFRHRGIGYGYDPRKHAIASCFLCDFNQADQISVHQGGEAEDFLWFSMDELPDDKDLWPGTRAMVEAIPRPDVGLTYEALHAEYVSHNELMWQTPVLAMTAMAFLLTIALGQGDSIPRALASLLSLLTSVASTQLMIKHSTNQLHNADQLWDLERKSGMYEVHRKPPRSTTKKRTFKVAIHDWFKAPMSELEKSLARFRSRRLWTVTLMLFGLVSLVAFINALVH